MLLCIPALSFHSPDRIRPRRSSVVVGLGSLARPGLRGYNAEHVARGAPERLQGALTAFRCGPLYNPKICSVILFNSGHRRTKDMNQADVAECASLPFCAVKALPRRSLPQAEEFLQLSHCHFPTHSIFSFERPCVLPLASAAVPHTRQREKIGMGHDLVF